MDERYSEAAGRAVNLARDEAVRMGHGHIGTEHLLLGILAAGDPQAARALGAEGATLDGCRQKVAEAVASKRGGESRAEPTLTDRAARALERAARLSLRQRASHVEVAHVLLSVLDVEGTAGQVLRGLSVDLPALRARVAAGAGSGPGEADTGPGETKTEPLRPVCPSCRTDLGGSLTHRVVPGAGPNGESQEYIVVCCGACGCALGASRAARDTRGSSPRR